MATSLDGLTDYVLAGIALRGVQGAGSKDFFDVVQKHYEESRHVPPSSSCLFGPNLPPGGLTRSFYEKVWDWVIGQPDIHVSSGQEASKLSLSQFEALEAQADATSNEAPIHQQSQPPEHSETDVVQSTSLPSGALSSLGSSLRQRLLTEGCHPVKAPDSEIHQGASNIFPLSVTRRLGGGGHDVGEGYFERASSADRKPSPVLPTQDIQAAERHSPPDARPRIRYRLRPPRNMPMPRATEPKAYEPLAPLVAPRLFASENRVWQAVAGHEVDWKKIPAMEFELLCIIATRRADGIAQPELVRVSGQDKRSVPERTRQLALKGYIVKKPHQWGVMHTTLCVHKPYAKEDDVLFKPHTIDEVFKGKNFVLSGFIYLLHKFLTEAGGVVPMRELRKRMGVPVEKWIGRAVRGAITRLSQTGMIKQVQIRRKGKRERYVICIKLLREPNEDDLKSHRPRRVALEAGPASEEVLEQDIDGDAFMYDVENDLVDVADSDKGDHDGDADGKVGEDEEIDHLPPQWTPDRLLCNMVFDMVELTGIDGADNDHLRERIVGGYWKRPMESLISRLTDCFQQSQPYDLRHLAIVRDNATTNKKKALHYLNRTYNYFKEAIREGEVVKIADDLDPPPNVFLDSWGFQPLSTNDFHDGNGSSTLAQCRPTPKTGRGGHQEWNSTSKPKKRAAGRQRWAGNSNSNRLSDKADSGVVDAMRPHEHETARGESPQPSARVKNKKGYVPLLTMEERRELGLPLRGRLGKEIENRIRLERGEKIKPSRPTKPRRHNDPEGPLLTMDQRQKLGLPRNGRLKESVLEELRRRRASGLPMDDPLPTDGNGSEFIRRDVLGMDEGADHPDGVDQSEYTSLASPMRSVHPTTGSAFFKRPAEGERAGSRERAKRARLDYHASDEVEPPSSPVRTGCEGSTVPTQPKLGLSGGSASITPKKSRLSARVPTSIQASKSLRSASTFSSAPATAPVVESTSEQPTVTSRTTKMKEQFSNPETDAILDQSLSEAEMRVEQIKAKYSNRTESGFYYNPFATRKTPRGRPPKVFLATFKLPRLPEFSWFTPAPIADGGSSSPRLPATADVVSLSEPVDLRDAVSESIIDIPAEVGVCTDPLVPDAPTKESAETNNPSVEPPEAAQQLAESPAPDDFIVGPSESARVHANVSEPLETSGSFANAVDTMDVLLSATSPAPVTRTNATQGSGSPQMPSANEQLPNVATQELTVSTALHQILDSSESRLSPAGWNTVNSSAINPSLPYKSPYSTPPPSQFSQITAAMDGTSTVPIDRTDSAAFSNAKESPAPLGVPISGEKPVNSSSPFIQIAKSRSKRKAQEGRSSGGIKLARGSVQHMRASIIRHAFELCHGVFPGNGEIVPVFEGLWKERAPKKLACPERTTIIKDFTDMIRDPAQKLRKMEILIPSIEVETPARKHLVVYRSIPKDSPLIHRARAGIHQAYPNRYFPPEISQYVNPEPKSISKLSLEIDNTVQVEDLFPGRTKRINTRINELARLRREEAKQKKQQKLEEAEERKRCSIEAEKVQLAKASPSDGKARGKQIRLVGLKHTSQPKRGPALSFAVLQAQLRNSSETSPEPSDSSEDTPLSLLRPRRSLTKLPPDTSTARDDVTISSDAESSSLGDEGDERDEEALPRLIPRHKIYERTGTLVSPAICFYPSNGTFSTEFHLSKEGGDSIVEVSAKVASISINAFSGRKKGRKRVRNVDPDDGGPHKKVRRTSWNSKPKQKLASRRDPTLVERLTGLTGNPNDPDYRPPSKGQRWSERKDRRRARPAKKYSESPDPVNKFKKLCSALAVAFSMSAEEGAVDWSIVARVYGEDPSFDLPKTKKTWLWMQKHMAARFRELTESFQSSFLEAYEEGAVASVDDPETYDWANLVRWSLLHCKHPELSLPVAREALGDYEVDVSPYEVIDRPGWYKNRLSSLNRTQRLLKCSYVAPLQHFKRHTSAAEDHALKARSWIRANISTPKALYDKKQAHDKLQPLGESIIGQVVSDFVEATFIRKWKIKRLRPGRNYDFTMGFAKNYRRTFELKDFMAAANMKKNLDMSFSREDPEKRAFAMSRTAEDGSVMAAMALVSAGQVKLVPRLPPINNDFGAPLPRFSVWGLNEGDYSSRHIDRQRLFWKVDVVPTPTYQFGSPLQPELIPCAPKEDGSPADWPALPPPPLPGRHDPNALLPIWSSINGEAVTWPWWHRILNLVLQTLMFQPGITAREIFLHCPKHTTEIFEIELVLGWLEAVKAVHRSDCGTYDVLPGFWAAFGDRLIGEEEDEFGEHVKRKGADKKRFEPTWRSSYNLRYSRMQQASNAIIDGSASEDEDEDSGSTPETGTRTVHEEIIRKPLKQYEIVRKARKTGVPRRGGRTRLKPVAPRSKAQVQQGATQPPIDPALLSTSPTPPTQDVDMNDPDRDAEGESDDEFARDTSMSVG
ncbi:hypothetical protein K458DRAFT_491169 [Lentithecium fluviatile CBS 122367]|uniref:Uncharacterized protein n=1 Tax=Lentithecium fluviatile CBS 122367 TaxID=1168545 RepID=A0A6G1IKA9_9PLEO|nr:hypothetical protein K458DRAFT_491169 [Lentithecium fluviatile CBS 122367]